MWSVTVVLCASCGEIQLNEFNFKVKYGRFKNYSMCVCKSGRATGILFRV